PPAERHVRHRRPVLPRLEHRALARDDRPARRGGARLTAALPRVAVTEARGDAPAASRAAMAAGAAAASTALRRAAWPGSRATRRGPPPPRAGGPGPPSRRGRSCGGRRTGSPPPASPPRAATRRPRTAPARPRRAAAWSPARARARKSRAPSDEILPRGLRSARVPRLTQNAPPDPPTHLFAAFTPCYGPTLPMIKTRILRKAIPAPTRRPRRA